MSRDSAEEGVFRAASASLKRWLTQARDAVMTPWRQYRAVPDPVAIQRTRPAWQAEVDRILAALDPALREGWAAANLPGEYEPNDPYIQANLALTKNLLVRIPDEVHAMVVAQIIEGTDAGESTKQIADRVDSVLTYSGSENWPNRARVIARTETTRHYSGSLLAHGLLVEKQDQRILLKQWDTVMDERERAEHRVANDQVRTLNQPFLVGGEPLLFPGDPSGSPSNVINCRCVIRLRDITP